MTVCVCSRQFVGVKNELSKTPMSLRLPKRSQTRIAEIQIKCGLKAPDVIRVAIDEFLDRNPSAEQVIRAVIKSKASA